MNTQSTPAQSRKGGYERAIAPEGFYTLADAAEMTGFTNRHIDITAQRMGLSFPFAKATNSNRQIKVLTIDDIQRVADKINQSKAKRGKGITVTTIETVALPTELTQEELWDRALDTLQSAGGNKATCAYWLGLGSLLYSDEIILEVGFSNPNDQRMAQNLREKHPWKEWINEAMGYEPNSRPLALKLKESKSPAFVEIAMKDASLEAVSKLKEKLETLPSEPARAIPIMEPVTTRKAPPTPKYQQDWEIPTAQEALSIAENKEANAIMSQKRGLRERIKSHLIGGITPEKEITIFCHEDFSLTQEAIEELEKKGYFVRRDERFNLNCLGLEGKVIKQPCLIVLTQPNKTEEPNIPIPDWKALKAQAEPSPRRWWQFWK